MLKVVIQTVWPVVGRPAWCHIVGEKKVSTLSHVLKFSHLISIEATKNIFSNTYSEQVIPFQFIPELYDYFTAPLCSLGMLPIFLLKYKSSVNYARYINLENKRKLVTHKPSQFLLWAFGYHHHFNTGYYFIINSILIRQQ